MKFAASFVSRAALASLAFALPGCHALRAGPPDGIVSPDQRAVQRYMASYLRARMEMETGHTTEAAETLKDAMQNKDCPPQFFETFAQLKMTARDFDEVDAVLERGLARHPSYPGLLLVRARMKGLRGDIAAAESDLEIALKAAPKREDLLEEMADVRLKKLKSSKTEDEAKSAIDGLIATYDTILSAREGAERVPPLLVTSSLYLHGKQTAKARERATEAVRLAPGDTRPRLTLAAVYEADKDTSGALAVYREAMLSDPDDPGLLGALGATLARLPREDARDFFTSLAAEKPDDRDVVERAFSELSSLREFDAARTLLEGCWRRRPDAGTRKLGLTFVSQLVADDRPDDAIAVLEAQRKIVPEDYLGAAMLISLYINRNHNDKALKYLAAMPDEIARANSSELTILHAQLLAQDHREEEALALYRGLIKRHGDVAEFHLQEGILCQELGRSKDAEAAYRRAVDLAPEYDEAYNSLGYFYAETGQKLDEAERLINKALKLSPNKGHILDSLGWVYYKQGKYKQAIEQIEQAAHLMPAKGNAEVYNHLGDAYRRVGNNAAAAEAWQKALELKAGPAEPEIKDKLKEVK